MTGPCDLAGDRLHGLEVARRGDREAGLDDVDAQARELVRDLELLGRVQRDARRLLAVAQGGVEDDDPVGGPWSLLLLASSCVLLRAGFAASRPPRAIPPEGGGGEVEGRAGTTCEPASLAAARLLHGNGGLHRRLLEGRRARRLGLALEERRIGEPAEGHQHDPEQQAADADEDRDLDAVPRLGVVEVLRVPLVP